MSRYLKIVEAEHIDRAGGVAQIDSDDATVLKPLQSIARPYGNGHGDWTETVVVTYEDGTTEKIRGHIVSTGVVE